MGRVQDKSPPRPALEVLEERTLFAAPTFASGVLIQANGKPLGVAIMSAPSVVDWNNDGRKDLLIGQFTEGRVKVFLNRGTNNAPVFTAGANVLCNGKVIKTSYG